MEPAPEPAPLWRHRAPSLSHKLYPMIDGHARASLRH
jgi:hypothetical protein